MDSITNKLQDLHEDVARRDAVAFRMHLHELAQRGLYDDVLDALMRDSWATGLDEGLWMTVAERLDVVSRSHEEFMGCD